MGYTPPEPPVSKIAPLNPAAPLSPMQPSANPIVNAAIGGGTAVVSNYAAGQVAGPELPIIASGINVIIEYLKNRKWFREEHWTIPLLIILSFAIAILVWYVVHGDLGKAITNAFGLISLGHTNYGSSVMGGFSIFKPTQDQNRWAQPTA